MTATPDPSPAKSSPLSPPLSPEAEAEDSKPKLTPKKRTSGSQSASPSKSPRKASGWSAEDDKKLITLTFVRKPDIDWNKVAEDMGGKWTANAVSLHFHRHIRPQFEDSTATKSNARGFKRAKKSDAPSSGDED